LQPKTKQALKAAALNFRCGVEKIKFDMPVARVVRLKPLLRIEDIFYKVTGGGRSVTAPTETDLKPNWK